MRLAFAAGGAATVSALLALIGAAALPTTAAVPTSAPDPAAGGLPGATSVRHVVQYVVLAPGQLPPTGAITTPSGTTPSAVVAAPVATPRPAPRPAVVTSQSGLP